MRLTLDDIEMEVGRDGLAAVLLAWSAALEDGEPETLGSWYDRNTDPPQAGEQEASNGTDCE